MPTPIYVISGFLGAGKTTLINNLLEDAPDSARIMVLVNEFGSISIDKKIIEADPFNIIDLSGGCICCGMFTELMSSLRFALDELRADVILIESTGLAVPREIARQALSPFLEGRVESGGIMEQKGSSLELSPSAEHQSPQTSARPLSCSVTYAVAPSTVSPSVVF